jgi:EAL domain-containing protein (putative c-di-GMP-specific phosphodiesterase class I)
MRSGDQFLGLVGIGTTDPRHAQHLTDDLPAVGEVAATAAALLGPTLLARRDAAAVRGRIETIIAERTFMPVFQAITTIPEREVVAYEALTRFTDGIRPDLHFANAAAAGLGVELELVTLEAAVRAAERIPRSLWLSLNVSPALIEAGDRLGRVLRKSHHQLVLELTEHVAVADYARLRTALRDVGAPFRIAVDDAGAGFSSMKHVVELGPSLVKLDLSLVRGIDGDPVRQALITGMRFFAERTDCRLLAEGIETEAEFATLAELGVPLGQGFLLGRPGEFVAPVVASAG